MAYYIGIGRLLWRCYERGASFGTASGGSELPVSKLRAADAQRERSKWLPTNRASGTAIRGSDCRDGRSVLLPHDGRTWP